MISIHLLAAFRDFCIDINIILSNTILLVLFGKIIKPEKKEEEMGAQKCARISASLRQHNRRNRLLEQGDFLGALGLYGRKSMGCDLEEQDLPPPTGFRQDGARFWRFQSSGRFSPMEVLLRKPQ